MNYRPSSLDSTTKIKYRQASEATVIGNTSTVWARDEIMKDDGFLRSGRNPWTATSRTRTTNLQIYSSACHHTEYELSLLISSRRFKSVLVATPNRYKSPCQSTEYTWSCKYSVINRNTCMPKQKHRPAKHIPVNYTALITITLPSHFFAKPNFQDF